MLCACVCLSVCLSACLYVRKKSRVAGLKEPLDRFWRVMVHWIDNAHTPMPLFFLFENRYRSIDFIDFQLSILKKLSNIVMLHIILDKFLGSKNESGNILSKIDTDRSIYPFSIDRCIDFEKNYPIYIVMLHIILDNFLGPEK